MKRIKIFLSLILSIVAFIFFTNATIKASDVNGLAMEPIYPSNQIVKNGILNPRVKAGSKQELSFNLINLSNQPIKVSISPNTAVTSDGPSIDYSRDKYKYDDSLKHNFKQIFSPKKIKLNVEPNKPTKVAFTANIPKKKFNGILMGAYYINTNQTSINNASGTAINNKYTYAMPVVMREDSVKAVPKLTLGKVTNGVSAKSPIVTSDIYNKRPAIIDHMTMDTKINDQDGNEIFKGSTGGNSVAPNSNFKYTNTIDNKDNLNPGKYHIKIVAKSPEGKWILEKDFTVTVGQYLGTILQNNQWIWLILALIVLAIIALIVYLIHRKHKKNKEMNVASRTRRAK